MKERSGHAPSRGVTGNTAVLLVEDEPLVRLAVSHYLTQGGYEVHEADSATTALESLEKHRVELLLTDMILPDMRGPELARRARERLPHLRTLYMSAHPRAYFTTREVNRMKGALLEKPFTEDELALKVREALEPGA